MDRIGLQALRAEMEADLQVAREASNAARSRFEEGGPAGADAAAFQLARCFNVIEQMARRVARAFENHIDSEEGWHVELIRRLSLDIQEVRPPLFSADTAGDLQQLRAFRHVVNHAYDLAVDAKRLKPLVDTAQAVIPKIEADVTRFLKEVAQRLSSES